MTESERNELTWLKTPRKHRADLIEFQTNGLAPTSEKGDAAVRSASWTRGISSTLVNAVDFNEVFPRLGLFITIDQKYSEELQKKHYFSAYVHLKIFYQLEEWLLNHIEVGVAEYLYPTYNTLKSKQKELLEKDEKIPV